jgi:hypothetical protein
MFSLYKSAFECDFNGEDVLTLSVKTEAVEALAKGLSARTFPYTVSSSARTPRRAGWGSAAVYRRAAAHIGVKGWKGISWWYRERVTRGTIHEGGLHEPGAF